MEKYGFYFSDKVVNIELRLATALSRIKAEEQAGREPSQDVQFSVPTLTFSLIGQMRKEIGFSLLNKKELGELFKLSREEG